MGLKDEDAAKVKSIHQLRPLRNGQPWGIFFVEFESKRMPVVVLRRILSHLVIKKRASANRAQAAAWDLHDLLFISAFGDEASAQREMAFAHFHQEDGRTAHPAGVGLGRRGHAAEAGPCGRHSGPAFAVAGRPRRRGCLAHPVERCLPPPASGT